MLWPSTNFVVAACVRKRYSRVTKMRPCSSPFFLVTSAAVALLLSGCTEVKTVTPKCDATNCDGVCVDGLCEDSACSEEVSCESEKACLSGDCDPLTGECVLRRTPNDTACMAGAGLCVDGECVDQERCAEVDCDDENECTMDECDPTTGLCDNAAVPDDLSCDFGGLPGRCTSGECADAMLCAAAQCNDDDECTADLCAPETGACSFPTLACDDEDPCTDDSCSPASGCSFTPIDCSDGIFCTSDVCSDGTCSNPNVRNGTNCTLTVFDPPQSCVRGSCISCANSGDCDDFNSCTVDTCSGQLCSYSNRPNGTSCGSNGTCFFGSCMGGIIIPPISL
jgi:hypothetical protein